MWQRFLPPTAAPPSNPAHAGKCVLITGAAGSIGSALARSLAASQVASLLLLDSSENGLFELDSTLNSTPHESFLGSIDDAPLLEAILTRHRPDIIYHAAAFKHVPMLEDNPFAAVANNALGTHALAESALRARVPKLVLISTDKAANPRSMLGVSKRIAELIVVSLSTAATQMNAIRLCNVIGSSGSVVPVFQRQIAQRAPVTVTHPEATRWFLTSSEAADAILHCGASASPASIVLPEAGEPVRIADLAKFLIADANVPIEFTSLRPGDKLDEEMFSGDETRTLSQAVLGSLIDELTQRVSQRDLDRLLRALQSAVPEYIPSPRVLQSIPAAASA